MIFSMLFSFSIVSNVANAKAQLKVYCINKHGKKEIPWKEISNTKKIDYSECMGEDDHSPGSYTGAISNEESKKKDKVDEQDSQKDH